MKEKALGALRHLWSQMEERSRRLPMSVHRSLNIGQKASATVIEVNGDLLLLGVTHSAVTLIERLPKRQRLEVRGVVR